MTFPIIPASTVNGAYQISRSLRFRSSASAYLSRTFGTPTDNKKWTFSCWVKRCALCADGNDRVLLSASSGTNVSHIIYNGGADTLRFLDFNGSTYGANLQTTSVYRDCSSWYHVTTVLDTTSATSTITGTSTDRIRFYVNGVQITSFNASVTVPTQNFTTYLNSAIAHTICKDARSAVSSYHDCYLAEVNFIDGAAKLPTDFGAFDTNGVWQPKAYTGTYGTNGFYLPFSATPTSSYSASFNGSSQYLTSATNAGLGLGTSDFTVEYWMNVTAATNGTTVCCAGDGTTSYDGLFGYITSGTLVTYLTSAAGVWNIASNRTILSSITTGRWYHIAFTRSGSTFRVFADGIQVDTFTSASALYQTANQFVLGRGQGVGYFNGLLSNVRVIKGTALYTSNFTPSAQPLTAVTNTQLLTLQNATIVDNSSNALSITNTGTVTTSSATPWSNYIAGQDSSGAGNNWTSANVNVTSTGTTYDSVIDVPTNYADGGNGRGNYATLNPLNKSSIQTISDANLTIASSGTSGSTLSTISVNSGKWYWEGFLSALSSNAGFCDFGFALATFGITNGLEASNAWCVNDTGQKTDNGTNTASWTGSNFAAGTDILMCAVDLDNGKAWFGKNGTWFQSGNPATGANAAVTSSLTGANITPAIGSSAGTSRSFTWNLNFGQRPFTYTPPSGFSALNTQNLPTPTIANGAQYMAAVTYAGSNSSQTITASSTNSGNNPIPTTFQPDFVWIKSRNSTDYHNLTDSVRGVSSNLFSNTTDAADTATRVTSFNSNGITLGGGFGYTNVAGQNYVVWEWNAGGAPTTDNVAGAGNVPTAGSVKINGSNSTSTLAGSIAATRLSANTSAGFSVVTYTGTGANATVGHGLGVAPSMIIVKRRSTTSNWPVYHISLGNAQGCFLNLTNGANSQPTLWASSSPNSTIFNVGTDTESNQNGANLVAYCFAPVSGYSSFGSYTGNGSADGPFVYTGFRPRYIIMKNATTGGAGYDWAIIDTSRMLYNGYTGSYQLAADLNNAEANSWNALDILSNGFKLRDSGAAENASGNTIIWAAFAENPFRTARAR